MFRDVSVSLSVNSILSDGIRCAGCSLVICQECIIVPSDRIDVLIKIVDFFRK